MIYFIIIIQLKWLAFLPALYSMMSINPVLLFSVVYGINVCPFSNLNCLGEAGTISHHSDYCVPELPKRILACWTDIFVL